jgi:NAD+ synthase (glutamine-hydrolysing)
MSKSSIFDEIHVADLVVDVANFEANIQNMVAAVKVALAEGKKIICTPELSLCGYPPEDLILHSDFKAACLSAQDDLLAVLSKIEGEFHFFFGNILPLDGDAHGQGYAAGEGYAKEWRVANAYFEVHSQSSTRIVRRYLKRDLPQYGVFDEKRYFVSGLDLDMDFQTEGSDTRIAVAICEDIWNGVDLRVPEHAELLLVPNASPYTNTKYARRLKALSRTFKKYHLPTLYFNARGANDELVFDECVIRYTDSFKPEPQIHELNAWKAIMQGLESYLRKNGFRSSVLGLSGGIDSALVATLAADALGGQCVQGVSMPSRYSSPGSKDDAAALAENIGCAYSVQSIEPMFNAYLESLPSKGLDLSDVAKENLQARIRGNIIMAYSNSSETPCLALATGNKSELAVGYSTIYGDAVGGYAPIKDLLKTEVFRLARWRNTLSADECEKYGLKAGVKPIPEDSITKPPSAELRPDQNDQQTLPEYDILDNIIDHLMQGDESFDAPKSTDVVMAMQNHTAVVEKVRHQLKNAQWKRFQYPPGPKLTDCAFGKDWRMPLTYKEY